MFSAIEQNNADSRDAIKEIFSEAFFSDAFYTHVVPDASVRKEKIKSIFSLAYTVGLNYGKVFTDAVNKVAAIWLPPYTHIGLLKAVRSGAASLALNMGLSATLRFKNLSDEIEQAREELACDGHWYLLLFGVDAKAQGTRLGKAMLQTNMESLSNGKEVFYLETFNQNNIAYYKKFGFELLEERKTKAGPSFWCMQTKPSGKKEVYSK